MTVIITYRTNVNIDFISDEAMPALLAAEASLKALNKNDITEVRTMKRPPSGVIYVIEAICIVKNVKPNKVCKLMSSYEFIIYGQLTLKINR